MARGLLVEDPLDRDRQPLESRVTALRSTITSAAPTPLPAPAPPPPSGPAPVFEGADQVAARLERLDMLRARNVITDAEHAAQRAQIIAEL